MQPESNPGIHLTYCTNIHPGETWPEVLEQLETHLPELKSRIAPEQMLGVGLRLSSRAAEDLLKDDALKQFKDWLQQEGLYVFTMNGFPYGSFHRQRVKDLVYAPDWRTEERVRYTRILIQILAKLLPEGMDGGISTSPLSYKPWLSSFSAREDALRSGSRNLAWVAYELAKINKEEGKELHLDIEPEPDCLLENSSETIDFFNNQLFPVGSAFLSDKFDLAPDEAGELIRNHIRICYDTCHFAVEYEKPEEALKKFREAGIKIGKTQVSAALKVDLNQTGTTRKEIAGRLSAFDEPVYLHQVIERRSGGALYHYRDLPEALPQIHNEEAEEWRIHFHVPVFVKNFGMMDSTQDDIVRGLQMLTGESECRHFEIETYTWEVLPEDLKTDLTGSIEREFNWVLEILNNEY